MQIYVLEKLTESPIILTIKPWLQFTSFDSLSGNALQGTLIYYNYCCYGRGNHSVIHTGGIVSFKTKLRKYQEWLHMEYIDQQAYQDD